MVKRYELTDAQWQRIEALLPGKESDPGRTAADNRLFVNGVLWVLQSAGSCWSIHCEHTGGLEDIPDARRVIVKALRQLIEPARARQVDVDDLNDATWARPHHDHAVGQQNRFGDTVRDV